MGMKELPPTTQTAAPNPHQAGIPIDSSSHQPGRRFHVSDEVQTHTPLTSLSGPPGNFISPQPAVKVRK